MAKAKGSQHRPGEVTALHVQRFKGPGKLKIGGGLYLVVAPTGNRRWVYRFTFATKPSELFLGPEGRLTLAEARVRCGEAKALVDVGIVGGVKISTRIIVQSVRDGLLIGFIEPRLSRTLRGLL